jgi:hypothetical protein
MLMSRPGSFISAAIKFLWHSFFNRFVKFNYAKLVKGPHRGVWRKKTGRRLYQHHPDLYTYLLDAGSLLSISKIITKVNDIQLHSSPGFMHLI